MDSSNSEARVVWKARSWKLIASSVLLEDGSFREAGYIDHPGSVVLVPLRNSNNGPEILMIRQYRRALGQVILELPAGTREPEEDWLVCAQRELQEETGYRAAHFQPLGRCWPAPGLSNELMAIFLATGLEPDPLPQDSDESIELTPMLLKELLPLALDGRLQDAKSTIGILRTVEFMKNS